MGYMGKSTTEENLKLKKSLKSGRLFLTRKDSYQDYFHWESKDQDLSTQPYIELSKKQLKSARKKRIKALRIFFLLFAIFAGLLFFLLGLSWQFLQ